MTDFRYLTYLPSVYEIRRYIQQENTAEPLYEVFKPEKERQTIPMFSKLFELLPDAEDLLNLEPEELAGPLLVSLIDNLKNNRGNDKTVFPNIIGYDNMKREINSSSHRIPNLNYPYGCREDVLLALMEAWQWLEREGFVAQRLTDLPSDSYPTSSTTYFVTRRGKSIQASEDLEAYRKANLLPKAQLHPVIAQKVWSIFLQGDYETAVFQAFKQVEVAVRNAGNYEETDIGVPLMRKAFHADTGNLTNPNQQPAEKEAIAHLFAGAIGYCRNPLGHREVNLSAEEAVEMIFLASYLLRIVDSRSQLEED